jgi:hypothetical protein
MTSWSLPPPEPRATSEPVRQGSEVLLVRWDAGLGVLLISHPWGLVLGMPEEIEKWRAELFEKLALIEKQQGGRFPVVVCVDGLTIRPSAAEDYGKVVRSYSDRFATRVARYSQKPNGVGQMITVAAMKVGFRANMFTSKTEAVAQALAGRDGSVPSRPRGGA